MKRFVVEFMTSFPSFDGIITREIVAKNRDIALSKARKYANKKGIVLYSISY